jgi:putative addiction module killer protein
MNSIQTTELFDTWFAGLKDKQAVRRVQARIDRAEGGNLGDCEPVGEGVSEMRIHYGPGYRVYFVQRGIEIVILLAGGNKATQARDIQTSLEIARQI